MGERGFLNISHTYFSTMWKTIGRGNSNVYADGNNDKACKVVKFDHEHSQTDFMLEAKWAQDMANLGLGPKVFNIDVKENHGVIVMQRYQTSLASYLKSGNNDVLPNLIAMLCHIAKHRIVCFDMKPENIVIDNDPSTMKLIDFGGDFCFQDIPNMCLEKKMTEEEISMTMVCANARRLL